MKSTGTTLNGTAPLPMFGIGMWRRFEASMKRST